MKCKIYDGFMRAKSFDLKNLRWSEICCCERGREMSLRGAGFAKEKVFGVTCEEGRERKEGPVCIRERDP